MVILVKSKFGLLLFAFGPNLYLLNFLLYTFLSFVTYRQILLIFIVFSMKISIHLQGAQRSFASIFDELFVFEYVLIAFFIFGDVLGAFAHLFMTFFLVDYLGQGLTDRRDLLL